jgi:hypothetical protein
VEAGTEEERVLDVVAVDLWMLEEDDLWVLEGNRSAVTDVDTGRTVVVDCTVVEVLRTTTVLVLREEEEEETDGGGTTSPGRA